MDINKGDKVKVRGQFSDFKHKYDDVWFEGEYLVNCSPSKYPHRVKVNGKYSDWKECIKIEELEK